MERVTGTASTPSQISQRRPDKKPVGQTDGSVSRPVDRPDNRPQEEIRSQALNPMDQTADRASPDTMALGDLSNLIHEMNTRLSSMNRNDHVIDLVYEDAIDAIVIQITERGSGDLIAQWPTEEMVSMRAAFRQMIGMIVDRKS